MAFVGFWLLLGGYVLVYWGQAMLRGNPISMKCLALGQCE